jgi:hypothetical protein
MDHVEAKWLLLRNLAVYDKYSYQQLRAMIGDSHFLAGHGRSGTEYQLEIDFIWDAEPDGDIRVIASIDDGRWRAFCPLGYDFLASPSR